MLTRRARLHDPAPLVCPTCGEAADRLQDIPSWSGARAIGCAACLTDAVAGVRLLGAHYERLLAW